VLSDVLVLKPEPDTVSVVPPIKEPVGGEMLYTSRMYSIVVFTPSLCNKTTRWAHFKGISPDKTADLEELDTELLNTV